jgi:thymidylate synthase
MAVPYFTGQTLDDIMHDVIEAIILRGDQISPTKGSAKELVGILIELTNPRARLSRTETRGKPFSCLGEFCWYLAKTNDLRFIAYYLPEYKQSADGDIIFGGYGPRLFSYRGHNQVANVINLLKRKPDSRQAVIQLFDAGDIAEVRKDIPCTCTLQFMIRQGALHLFTYMRSNDVFRGLPHDVFCFTLLQEIVARTLSAELGTYKHAVGSLHLYDTNREMAEKFLDEGWQSTISMPAMPTGNPWPALDFLRDAELAIRTRGVHSLAGLEILDHYWADLIRLLQVFRLYKDKDANKVKELRDKMSSNIYYPFIDQRLRQLSIQTDNEAV